MAKKIKGLGQIDPEVNAVWESIPDTTPPVAQAAEGVVQGVKALADEVVEGLDELQQILMNNTKKLEKEVEAAKSAAGGGGGGKKKPPTAEATPEDEANKKKREQEKLEREAAAARRKLEADAKAMGMKLPAQPISPERQAAVLAAGGVPVKTPPPSAFGTGNPTQGPGSAAEPPWGTPLSERATLQSQFPRLFQAGEIATGKKLLDENLPVSTKLVTDLDSALRKLTITLKDASGATTQVDIAEDLRTGTVGKESNVIQRRKDEEKFARQQLERQENYLQRTKLKSENPRLFETAENATEVPDLAARDVTATVKVVTDLDNAIKKLTVTMRDASGATTDVTVSEDLTANPRSIRRFGTEDQINQYRKERADAEKEAQRRQENYANRLTQKSMYPDLFAEGEKQTKVDNLAGIGLDATTKVVTDLEGSFRKLTITLKEANGATREATVVQDLAAQPGAPTVGLEKDIMPQINQRLDMERTLKYNREMQAKFNSMGSQYASVFNELGKRDPEFFQPNAITGVNVKQRNNVRTFDVSREDQMGNTVQARIMTDLNGKIIPETTRRTTDFTSAIKQNMGEFLKWSVAVGLVYTPLLKLQELVQTSITNQSLLTNVMITMNAAQEDTNKIFNSAADIANATGTSITGVIEGYNQAFRATGDIADETERYTKTNILLKDSITLSKLAEIDQASATDILVASLRQTGIAIEDGSSLLDKWVRVSKSANVDVNTLATSFAIVAESADAAGLSVDDLNGLIATVAASGITSARETGNAVRAIISGVTSDGAIKELERFGIAVTNTEGKARAFKDIITDIKAGVDTGAISGDQLNTIARAIGGGNRRQAQVVTAIVGQDTTSQVARESAKADGEAQAALARELQTVESASIRLGNAFQKLAQVLGTEGGVLAVVTALTDKSAATVEALAKVAGVLGTAGPALLLGGVAKAIDLNKTLDTVGFGIAKKVGQTAGSFEDRNKAIQMSGGTVPLIGFGNNDYAQMSYRLLQSERAQRNDQAYLNFGRGVQKYAPGVLTAGAMAAGDLAEGNYGKAGITAGAAMAAEFGGLALGMAPGIGAAIGGTAAQLFIQMWDKAVNEAMSRDYNFNKNGEDDTTDDTDTGGTQAFNELSRNSKLGFLAMAGTADVSKMKPEDIKRISELGVKQVEQVATFGGTDPYDAALQVANGKSFNLGAQTGIEREIVKQQANIDNVSLTKQDIERIMSVSIVEEVVADPLTNAFNKLKESVGNTGQITDIQDKAREDLKSRMEPYAPDKLTVRGYTTAMTNVEGYQSKLQVLTAASMTNQLQGLGDGVDTTTEALDVFANLLNKGATESVGEIVALANEIGDLYAKIEAAKSIGGTTIDYAGQKLELPDAQAKLASKQEAYSTAISTEATNIQLRTPIRDIVSMIDLTSQQFALVQQEAMRMYNEDLEALTDVEKAAALARDANIKYLVKTKEDYENLEKLPSSYLSQSTSKLQDTGVLKQQYAGFSQSDLTTAQYQQALSMYGQRLAQVQGVAKAAGSEFKEQKSQEVVLAKDGMLWLDVDMRIMQTLLAEISKNTEKMIDGIYNLPAGASFYVPAQTVPLYPSGGDGGNGAGGGGGSTPTNPAQDFLRDTESINNASSGRYNAMYQQSTAPKPVSGGSIDPFEMWNQALSKVKPQTPGLTTMPDRFLREDNLDVDSLRLDSKKIGGEGFALSVGSGFGKMGGGDMSSPAINSLLSKLGELKTALASARVNLSINSTTTLLVDGRQMAMVVKKYLRDDLSAFTGSNTTASVSVA